MPKRTSAAKRQTNPDVPIRVVIVTLDNHLASTVERAHRKLAKDYPGLSLSLHAASEWETNPDSLDDCRAEIGNADIVIASMLFMDDHIKAILPSLEARRNNCDAIVGCMSAGEIIRLTRMGGFTMSGADRGPLALLKRLRGSSDKRSTNSSGAKQMAMLKRIPKLLKFIPGSAQDARNYFLTFQYWLAGSEKNLVNMVRLLISRYADGPRRALRSTRRISAPAEYPEVGLYHPDIKGGVTRDLGKLPARGKMSQGVVGLLVMRSYVLAGNTAHYDGVIRALEDRGLAVVPAFASGLDARPAIEDYFLKDGKAEVDAVVSLTGFSLVGGPAYNDAGAAEKILAALDVPFIAAHSVEFQSLEHWERSAHGLMPVEATMMVAIPELDGATGPMLFGGRSEAATKGRQRDMCSHAERAQMLASRVSKLVSLRRSDRAERKLAVVLFNFPPNGGSTGTAAHLSVFESLYNVLVSLKREGYSVDVPDSVDALRYQIIEGNASRFGADANVHTRISADDHVRHERWLNEIEGQWGPAPGKHQSNGQSIYVLGHQFGNIFVGVQPAFGYEGDPMRLLFESGLAPTHAFSAFYRYVREDFGADAVLHFGTHGALEFMPGKQVGMSDKCWPDRLIGDLPNFYLYAANNPSEGTIAKRRTAATLISYLTPPVANAELHKELTDLKAAVERFRSLPPENENERNALAGTISSLATELELVDAGPVWTAEDDEAVLTLRNDLLEIETSLIPYGLHVVGAAPSVQERTDLVKAAGESITGRPLSEADAHALANPGELDRDDHRGLLSESSEDERRQLLELSASLSEDSEIPAILQALDGRYIRPVVGGDLIRTPSIAPTGRNLHGFDPYRIPSAFALSDGKEQADRLLARHLQEEQQLPESVAMVLWGTDNIKSEGGPIAQALSLIGARPRLDSYGRVCGAELIPLVEMGRPRIDVVVTLSGIFRDLLPLQTRMLAEASYLAATADETCEQNFVRKHALAYQELHNCDLETAALRVFSNADGAYGSNVSHMIDSSCWQDEEEIGEVFSRRKCFAYGRSGPPEANADLLKAILGDVDLAYQNIDSVELGVTTIDHYFDTLGGINRAIHSVQGQSTSIYIGDQTRGEGRVRTLDEQVSLEARTRTLNPKWYEGMLKHGYEGVRQIEAHVTNTMGWSATTGQVAPWIYEQITQTFVLDAQMRDRLAELNPKASVKMANRLLEAHDRNYWSPDESVLEALRNAGRDLEDQLEGVSAEAAA